MIDPQEIFKRLASDSEADASLPPTNSMSPSPRTAAIPTIGCCTRKAPSHHAIRTASDRAATVWEAMCKATEEDRDRENLFRKR